MCRTHYSEDSRRKPGEDCEECQRDFETSSSYCGICWKIVSNKVFLSKKSPHVTGKCREKHSIPRSIFQRTVDKKPAYPWPDGWHTPMKDDAFIPYQWLKLDGSPLIEQSTGEEIEDVVSDDIVDDDIVPEQEPAIDATREIELLEEQNKLLRRLAAL